MSQRSRSVRNASAATERNAREARVRRDTRFERARDRDGPPGDCASHHATGAQAVPRRRARPRAGADAVAAVTYGRASCADYDGQHARGDGVYVTTDPTSAAVYATLAPGSGHGNVYEVKPLGKLEPDPPGKIDTHFYAAAAATVVAASAAPFRLRKLLRVWPPSCYGWRATMPPR
ncbi:MAG: NAD(+)--rifampin ADP-ribosyltransferase [Gaiellaceae bacterium]